MGHPEKNFENKIKKFFRKEGLYYFKFWGTMYTRAGVPDLIVCVNGRFLGVEVKSEVGKPSEIQLQNIREIRNNGGFGVVIHPEQFQNLVDLIFALKDGYEPKARLIEQGLTPLE